MLALPPSGKASGGDTRPRLPCDHYVRLDGNDYSVHPVAVGRRIEVNGDLHRIQVWCAGTMVAEHQRICAART
ncbi:MAG: hypothetical protein QOK02_1371 [Mycobacterium sp.]|nr:hypothetical protein [Mycobacterium sp.]